MFFRTFLVVTLAAVSLVPGMAQGGDQAFDPLQLNIRLSPTALRPPSHLIKQQWTLDGYRLGRLVPQAPQAAVIEDDARRRLLILSATDEGQVLVYEVATCGWTSPLACARLSSVCAPASVRINGWTRPANSAAWPSACWSTCTSEGLRAIALPDPPSGRRGTRRRSLRLPPETPPTAGGHAAPPVVLPLQRAGPQYRSFLCGYEPPVITSEGGINLRDLTFDVQVSAFLGKSQADKAGLRRKLERYLELAPILRYKADK